MEETGLSVEVYVDVLLAVNFIMDFFILWVTGKACGLKIRVLRLFAGALLGAMYALVVFIPETSVLVSLGAKILCSFFMLLLAFAPLSPGRFCRAVCYMYLASFAMGGAVIGAVYIFSNKQGAVHSLNGAAVLTGTFSYPWLIIAVLTALFLGNGGIAWVKKNFLAQRLVYKLIIGIEDKEIQVEALLDTGNQLTDSLTQKPVIIIGTQVLEGYVPLEILEAAGSDGNTDITGLGNILEERWMKRLRLLNFNSVGKKHGLMVGLRADYAEVRTDIKTIRSEEIVIGLLKGALKKSSKYQALLPPQLIDATIYKEDLYAASQKNVSYKL